MTPEVQYDESSRPGCLVVTDSTRIECLIEKTELNMQAITIIFTMAVAVVAIIQRIFCSSQDNTA